jgi:prepilin-type N-terminal cleavage/methylation domain-containing protein
MQNPRNGFTLAELLIALALLGVVAAFAVPKIMQATESKQASSKIREAVSVLEQSFYNRKFLDRYTFNAGIVYGPGQKLYHSIHESLNVLDKGDGAVPLTILPANHPCLDPNEANAPTGWVLFPNGLVVTGLTSGADFDALPFNDVSHDHNQNYIICIDYNGNDSPNRKGQDVFVGNFHLYGGFTGPPNSESQRSFNWGGTTANVFAIGGAPGTILGTNAPLIGDATAQPSAVVGAVFQD